MDCAACRLPRAEILPGMGRDSVVAPDGSIINTCATEVLVEVLRYLKRAYWPFPWEAGAVDRRPDDWAGGSGFLGAAKVLPRLPAPPSTPQGQKVCASCCSAGHRMACRLACVHGCCVVGSSCIMLSINQLATHQPGPAAARGHQRPPCVCSIDACRMWMSCLQTVHV